REERLRRSVRVVRGQRGDESGDVASRRAGNQARRRGVGPAALEAPVGFEEHVLAAERRTKLLEDWFAGRRDAHANASSSARTCTSRWTGVSRARPTRQASLA